VLMIEPAEWTPDELLQELQALVWLGGRGDATWISEQHGLRGREAVERRMLCAVQHGLATTDPRGHFELTDAGWEHVRRWFDDEPH
jgi:hypothetical protein